MSPREGASFGKSKEEANGHDALGIMYSCGHHSQGTPKQDHRWEEDPWAEVCQGQVGWDLAYNVPHRKDGIDHIELIAMKGQLLFHTRDICIG